MDLPLYFAFPDGVFHYVCAECNALCCRAGGGFGGSFRREMSTLLILYPELQTLAVGRQGDYISITTPVGHCHFLEDDNRCRIEIQHGKALKPGVCTLFPFNVFTRIGNAIAVSPHFLMCPLRLQLPARPGEVEGTHAALGAAVRESALLPSDRAILDARMPRTPLHPSEPGRSALEREQRFRDACGRALTRQSFQEVVRHTSTNPAQLDSRVAQAARVLGLPPPPETHRRDGIDDLLLALAPSVRLDYLRLPAEGILLVLALAERVLRRVLPLSSGSPTPQGAYQLIHSISSALSLLGCADEPMAVPRNAHKRLPFFGDAEMTFAAYHVLSASSPIPAILDLLESAMERLSTVADRTAFLVEMGSRLKPAGRRSRRR